MQIYIKDRKRRKEEFQFFMHDFVDACKKNGFKSKPDLIPDYRWHYRALLRDVFFCFYSFIHHAFPSFIKRKRALLIAANGSTIKDIAFPYFFNYEIVPFLWDVWPYSHGRLFKSLKDFDVKYIFVTSSQIATLINLNTSTKAFWIPEGIKSSHYVNNKKLSERKCDVFEMGRQLGCYHCILNKMAISGKIASYRTSNIQKEGNLDDKNVAYSNEELYYMISDTKIMICFPKCDTNKKNAGNIETLTQRYWEAMLSGCVMVGRAPKELIDLIGYNPVIDVDWNGPERQIIDIIDNINRYQSIVDKNYETAKKYADWDNRLPEILKILSNCGYII